MLRALPEQSISTAFGNAMNRSPTDRLELSVVVPVWNEVDSIGGVLSALAECRESFDHLDVVVVDDGSTDGSAEKIAEIAGGLSWVEVITNEERKGYGAALSRGFDSATTRFVGFIDGDGQIDPADLARACQHLSAGVSAVIGIRGSRADSLLRRVLGKLGTYFVRPLVGFDVIDVNAGLKVFDTAICPIDGLGSSGGMISTELLIRASASGDVKQIPIRHSPRLFGESSGASVRVLAGIAVDFVRLRKKNI